MPPKGKSYRLLAFDPGERTGYVSVRLSPEFDPRRENDAEAFRIRRQGVLPVRKMAAQLSGLVSEVDLVAYETWRLYSHYALKMIGNDMQPSQVVGMIRYEAWAQRRPLAAYGAYIKEAAVGTMPAWLREHMSLSSEQHDQDAIMHAWYVASQRFYDKLKLEGDA